MTEATRRLNQLEAGLERIQDPIVREAMSGLLEYVQSVQGSGVTSRGTLAAQTGFQIGDVFRVDKDGNLKAESFQTGTDGVFKTKYFQGSVATGTVEYLSIGGGKIIGIVGWTETDSGSTSWSIIGETTSTARNYVGVTSDHRVAITHLHGSNTYDYRVLVFYRDA